MVTPLSLRDDVPALPEAGRAQWRDLCARYLPLTDERNVWRYSRAAVPADPAQGWKLHIAATVLTASAVLERVGPFLRSHAIQFKGPYSLEILSKINSGLFFGYSQVGKCFTIYPANDAECVYLAGHLHNLTAGLAAPIIPFDGRYSQSGSVYYRYGSFKHQNVLNNGTLIPAISDQTGQMVPDSRLSIGPEWAACPFTAEEAVASPTSSVSPLGTTIKIFEAISQRGKGGVYRAADFSTPVPRLCILKEGRRHGEVTFDGRDGHERVKHEKEALQTLRQCDVKVPRVFSSFEEDDNFYLLLEYVEGKVLESWLKTRRRRLPVITALKLGIQVAEILARIHSAGWVWRDCKPANLIWNGKVLRPIDFEGACRIGNNSRLDWATRSFISTSDDRSDQSQPSVDLYALGIVIYYLLTGKFLGDDKRDAIGNLRKGIPAGVRSILTKLLSSLAQDRPSAATVINELNRIVVSLQPTAVRVLD